VAAEELLQEFSLRKAQTRTSLIDMYAQTRPHTTTLRAFYQQPWLKRARRAVEFRIAYIKRAMVLETNRKFAPPRAVRRRDKALRQPPVVHAIGHAGTGVGLRIKGNFRMGGQWHRQQVMRQGIGLVVQEARTSQTCPYCGMKIVHPMKRLGGKVRVNQGTSTCVNPSCPAVMANKASFPRDDLSALCIALRAFAQIQGKDWPSAWYKQ
jgi:hypothetical protein